MILRLTRGGSHATEGTPTSKFLHSGLEWRFQRLVVCLNCHAGQRWLQILAYCESDNENTQIVSNIRYLFNWWMVVANSPNWRASCFKAFSKNNCVQQYSINTISNSFQNNTWLYFSPKLDKNRNIQNFLNTNLMMINSWFSNKIQNL